MSVVRGELMNLSQMTELRQDSQLLYRLNTVFGGLLLITLLGMLVVGIYYYSQPDTLPIKKVKVQGEFRHLSPSRLQSLVTEQVTGGFFTINVAKVRDVLLQAPWVEQVSVSRIWPDTLRVHVKERQAVVRWGDKGLLNADAVYFVPPPATIPSDMPVLHGPEGSYRLMLDKYYELRNILQHVDLKLMSLTMNQRRAWRFTVDAGYEVIIGRTEYERRVRRFSQVVVKAMADRLGQVKKVDMRYTNGFAIEWLEQMPGAAGVDING